VIFRIYKVAFPALVRSFGEDLFTDAILIVYKKIESYDLDYCDKEGNPNPVKFSSYIRKRIDGFITDSLKKELNESNFYNRYNEHTVKNEDLYPIFGQAEVDKSIF
jgi:DNA-directed RNA polymerase specialized sigma subunit